MCRYSDEELAFILAMVPLSRAEDLCFALKRSSAPAIRAVMRQLGIRGRAQGQPPLARAAVAEAWRRRQMHLPANTHLAYWAQEEGKHLANRKRAWTLGDDETLRELVGREPIAKIAKRLRRTVPGVKVRMWRLGIRSQAVANTTGALAKQLHVHPRTVWLFCVAGLLRSWKEGGWMIVHADDAEWLLAHYRYYETPWQGKLKAVTA
jgi:hypothetical protein